MWQQMNRNPRTTLADCQEIDCGVTEKLGIIHRCAVGSNITLFSLLEFVPFVTWHSARVCTSGVLWLNYSFTTFLTHILKPHNMPWTHTPHLPVTARGHCMSCSARGEGGEVGKGWWWVRGGGYKHPLLPASSLHFPAFTSPKVAHKDHLSCAASAPPLSPPGCPPHQYIPCQENERTPVLNATLCVHGRAGPALHRGTKAGVNSIHGTATLILPSRPLPYLLSRLFILWRCPELRSVLRAWVRRGNKTTEPSAAAPDGWTSKWQHCWASLLPYQLHNTPTHCPSPSSYPHSPTLPSIHLPPSHLPHARLY